MSDLESDVLHVAETLLNAEPLGYGGRNPGDIGYVIIGEDAVGFMVKTLRQVAEQLAQRDAFVPEGDRRATPPETANRVWKTNPHMVDGPYETVVPQPEGPWAPGEFTAEQVWNKALGAKEPVAPPSHEPTTVVRLTASEVRSLLADLELTLLRFDRHQKMLDERGIPTDGVDYTSLRVRDLHQSICRQTSEFMQVDEFANVFTPRVTIRPPQR